MGWLPWHKNFNFGKGGVDWADARQALDLVIETVGAAYGIPINMSDLRSRFREQGVPEDMIDDLITQFVNETGVQPVYDNQYESNNEQYVDSTSQTNNMSFANIAIIGLLVIMAFKFLK
jgi:hypothetical protein